MGIKQLACNYAYSVRSRTPHRLHLPRVRYDPRHRPLRGGPSAAGRPSQII